MKMERTKLGIRKIDAMIEGGVPQNSVIGLCGPPGVGKSIFTMHYLLEGARNGQTCIYINLEEPLKNIMRMIDSFKFAEEFKEYIDANKIIIKCYSYKEFDNIYDNFFKKIKDDKKITRIVIDSFNGFYNYSISEKKNPRLMINKAFSVLRDKDATTLLTLEKQKIATGDIYYDVSYLVDGMIKLDFLELGSIERQIFIPKMRWTKQHKESKSYDIQTRGIVIHNE